jgi:hypothetical protein
MLIKPTMKLLFNAIYAWVPSQSSLVMGLVALGAVVIYLLVVSKEIGKRGKKD